MERYKAVIFVSMVLASFLTGNCLGQMPTVLSFGADPAQICIGQGVNLSWQVDDAENISIEPDLNVVDAVGQKNIFPKNNTTYKLTASNANGNITAELNVVAIDCIAIEKFMAEPQEVCKGSNATLQWIVVGASNVTIDHDIGEVPSTGFIEVTGNETTTYNITAINGTRVSSANSTLIVDLSCPSIDYFEVDTPDIIKGSNATLSWNVTNAENASLDNGIGEVDHQGSMQVSPDSSVIYKLNATNGTNSVTSEKIVNVSVKFPEIIDFAAIPSTVVRGTNSTLSWNVTGADFVSIDPNIGKIAVAANDSQNVIVEESMTYILTAGNASGNVTETETISVNNIAYDFVARAPYARWYSEKDGYQQDLKFPGAERSEYGFAKYDDESHSILKIGPPEEGFIIGDYTEDMRAMGYFIDSRDVIDFQAELGWSPLGDIIIGPKLGVVTLDNYNLFNYLPFRGSVQTLIPLREYASNQPVFSIKLDANGGNSGDHTYIKEMRISRDQ
jgi:hypothetical protein